MRRLLGVGVLLLLMGLVAAGAVGGWLLLGEREPGVSYTVVRGDTLFEIARAHGVTVDELRAWNGIEGDLIEVGDVLWIRAGQAVEEAVATTPRPRRSARRSAGTASAVDEPSDADEAWPALRLPPERACLTGPSADTLAEHDMAASEGLSYPQVKAAMDAFLPNTLRCLPDGGASGRVELEITVACTGRVSQVAVTDRGSLAPEITACVQDVLRHAPFPAHDLPDGETFRYPLTFATP